MFLCVANHDKLLPGLVELSINILHGFALLTHPLVYLCFKFCSLKCFSFFGGSGWSHFAQFTIAVVNKDAKKSKYSGQWSKTDVLLYMQLRLEWFSWYWYEMCKLSQIRYIVSGKKSMIGGGKSLWSYLKCQMVLWMQTTYLPLRLKFKWSGSLHFFSLIFLVPLRMKKEFYWSERGGSISFGW